jgi:hypothetical protein
LGGFPHGKMEGPFMQLPSKTTSISMLKDDILACVET